MLSRIFVRMYIMAHRFGYGYEAILEANCTQIVGACGINSAPKRCVIPKEKAMLCRFSFGITHFWGVGIIRGNKVQ